MKLEEFSLFWSKFRFISYTCRWCFSIESSWCSGFTCRWLHIELKHKSFVIRLKQWIFLHFFVVHEQRVAALVHHVLMHQLTHSSFLCDLTEDELVPKKKKNVFIVKISLSHYEITFPIRPSIRSKASNISRYFLLRRV